MYFYPTYLGIIYGNEKKKEFYKYICKMLATHMACKQIRKLKNIYINVIFMNRNSGIRIELLLLCLDINKVFHSFFTLIEYAVVLTYKVLF